MATLLEKEFMKEANDVRNLKRRPTDEELCILYGLYKQASEGDVKADSPSSLDLKAKVKWKAWNERKGMSREEAMKLYCRAAREINNKYACSE